MDSTIIRERAHSIPTAQQPLLGLGKQARTSESLIQGFLFLCGFMTIFTTIAIIVVLGRESLLLLTSEYIDESGAIHSIGVLDFVNSTEWQPHRYKVGIAPLATWRRSTAQRLGRALIVPVILAAGLMALLFATGTDNLAQGGDLRPPRPQLLPTLRIEALQEIELIRLQLTERKLDPVAETQLFLDKGQPWKFGNHRFNMVSIPPGATITSATLKPTVTTARTNNITSVHRMITPWTELGASWGDPNGATAGDWVAGIFGSGDYSATSLDNPHRSRTTSGYKR